MDILLLWGLMIGTGVGALFQRISLAHVFRMGRREKGKLGDLEI